MIADPFYNSEWADAYSVLQVVGSNIKDLMMGWTFTYFAYNLTVYSEK